MDKLISDPLSIYILLLSFVIVVIILFFITEKITAFSQKKKTKFYEYVKQTSPRYKAIIELNSKYTFDPIPGSKDFQYSLPSKASFDRFNFYSAAVAEISKNINVYKLFLTSIDKNYDLYRQYRLAITEIPDFLNSKEAKKLHVKYKKYNKAETIVTEEILLKPVISFVINVFISYVSPQGRNSYSCTKTFFPSEIKEMIKHAENKQIVTQTVAYQRSLMTDSLRYDVMKRDNFRCVLCGKTAADGVKLEVDHIKPVSKGGKTEAGNLRTLCNICNSGKRAKYDPYGNN